MLRRKLIVVSGVNFLRAYSGIIYLSSSLADRGMDVEVYAPIPRAMLREVREVRFPVHSMYAPWYGRIPRVRVHLFRLSLFARCLLETPAALIFSELNFFREAVWLKRLRPQVPLIHYCQELLTPEEFPGFRGLRFYERNAGAPDLVLDVEPHRAAARRDRFKISREIMVLPNTLPLSSVPAPAPKGSLAKLAGCGVPTDVPILIYIGGVHEGTGLKTIIEALEGIQHRYFFLGFCHGASREAVEDFGKQVEFRLGSRRGRICHALPRSVLLSCLHEATAGLVYYPQSELPSLNQRFCAPTKLFEYISVGVPVIASANPPLVELLEGKRLGVCAKNDSAGALRTAILTILTRSEHWFAKRERARRIFAEELCFEKTAVPVLETIMTLIATGKDGGLSNGHGLTAW